MSAALLLRRLALPAKVPAAGVADRRVRRRGDVRAGQPPALGFVLAAAFYAMNCRVIFSAMHGMEPPWPMSLGLRPPGTGRARQRR